MKTCARCKRLLALTSEFWHRDSNRPDGYDRQCKECKRARRADLYSRNAEAEKALVREWRRENPDKHRAQHSTRRARKYDNGPVESISYFIVFQRDCGQCKLCLLDVDKNAVYPDPLAGTIDHVIPLSKGGTHTYDNVQLAHSICNSRKGNRID